MHVHFTVIVMVVVMVVVIVIVVVIIVMMAVAVAVLVQPSSAMGKPTKAATVISVKAVYGSKGLMAHLSNILDDFGEVSAKLFSLFLSTDGGLTLPCTIFPRSPCMRREHHPSASLRTSP